MKLRNKETGELGTPRIDYQKIYVDTENGYKYRYESFQKMCEEWEDATEEPKEYWHIDFDGSLMQTSDIKCDKYVFDKLKEIGNYFETKEEAKKAVEKLKALKRLKDKGMRTYSFKREKRGIDLDFYTLTILAPRDKDSLGLLFGGEE